ncbi:MAG: hypothetical protein IIV78_01300 [Oscillospiraceae bacterium]|nr:hypothetical protein [Oscillospiraceae bacterium]MBQ5739024.1 hypothetical protein [Oscillospiraceae bacterium]
MWLSKRIKKKNPTSAAARGTVSIGGAEAAVLAEGEMRALRALAPGGYVWRPRSGAQVLVMKGEGKCILGELGEGGIALAPGEVCIHSLGGASITLRNSGRVEITGAVYVNGEALE